MRWILILALFACDASRSTLPDHGVLEFGDGGADLSTLPDLAGVDFAGADLRSLPDLAVADDLAGVDSAGTLTPADSCGNAATLVAGVVYDDQDTTGLADDYHIGALSAGGCNTNNNVYKEPDAAYTISVPAAKTLTVTVTPENIPTVWDPAIAIVGDCADGATCLAGHDDSDLTGQDEVASWTNTTGAAKNVFVIVDSYYHSGTLNYGYGRYRITATLQ